MNAHDVGHFFGSLIPKTGKAVAAVPEAIKPVASAFARGLTTRPMTLTEQIATHAIQEKLMATSPVPAPKVTFLQHIGKILQAILHIGEAAATVAEPFVAASFPEVIPIYQTAIGLATAAEATALSATGTGAQKLAQVATTLVPQVQAWAVANGINWPEAEITKWASALVDSLNMIPAPATAPSASVVS